METELLDKSLMILYDKKQNFIPRGLHMALLEKGFYNPTDIDPVRLLERIYSIGFAHKEKDNYASRGHNKDMYVYNINTAGIHFIENLPHEFKEKPYSFYLNLKEDEKIKKEELETLGKRQTQSVIDTNVNVQRSNDFQI